jgi:hypothetical protein
MKFEHLRQTKDLAATSAEKRREDRIPETKPQPRAATPVTPQRRIDRSFSTQLNSFAGFVLPVAGPAIGKTTLRAGFAVRRDDEGQAANVG